MIDIHDLPTNRLMEEGRTPHLDPTDGGGEDRGCRKAKHLKALQNRHLILGAGYESQGKSLCSKFCAFRNDCEHQTSRRNLRHTLLVQPKGLAAWFQQQPARCYQLPWRGDHHPLPVCPPLTGIQANSSAHLAIRYRARWTKPPHVCQITFKSD